jgi:acyl-CoA synthetase (AMP-forming)/AMP-acid ligase II
MGILSSSQTLWDRLVNRGRRTSLHCWTASRYEGAPWDRVVRDAENMTAGLRNAGVQPGSRVAAILGNTGHAARGLLGVWLAGGVLASFPLPSRGMDTAEYASQVEAICDRLDSVLLITDDELLAMLPDDVRTRVRARRWQDFCDSGAVAACPPADDEPAFIQFSSGSVGVPKGCVLTPRAIAAQLDIIAGFTDPGSNETMASWLPLSHDMGMFGFLLYCLDSDVEAYLSTPLRFAFAPATWFSDMAQVGATITAGTNSALHLAARASGRSQQHWPDGGLTALRVCVIGAERVEAGTLQFAAHTLGSAGLAPEAFMPAYGMAEATLAVTTTPWHELPRYVTVDTIALGAGDLQEVEVDHPNAVALVSSGPPCTGVSLTGMPANGIGEITVSSPSLAEGYWRDEHRTAAAFRDGAFATADMGFLRDGYLYPVGRTDDMISIAGRKVYAREIERAVEVIPGVRRGCSTLIKHPDGGKPRLTLLMEVRSGHSDYHGVATEAAAVSMAKAAVAIDECIFLERDALPKTPSGKIQRHRCHALMQAGSFEPLATIRLAGR